MTRRQFRALRVLYRSLSNEQQRTHFYQCFPAVYRAIERENVSPRRGLWSDRRRAAKLEQLRRQKTMPSGLSLLDQFEWLTRPGGAA
jgi:hypothetical protein